MNRINQDQWLDTTRPPNENGRQQKWFWFWRTRRLSGINGTKAPPTLSSTLPSPPPAPSLWNHTFHEIHTTKTNNCTVHQPGGLIRHRRRSETPSFPSIWYVVVLSLERIRDNGSVGSYRESFLFYWSLLQSFPPLW
jgi:hypothetical protein